MSFQGSGTFDVRRKDEYHVSPTMVPATGFLTPPYEVRRDSVASSQSSMSSFASCLSEYSGPVTPTGAHTPSTEEGYVDAMAYDFNSHSLQSQPMLGLPLSQQSKAATPDQNIFASWHFVPHSTEASEPLSAPFAPQLMLPTNEEFLHTHMAESTGMDTTIAPDVESPWVNVHTNFHQDLGRQWDNGGLEQVVSDDLSQALWPAQMHAVNSSVAMTDIVSGYTQMDTDCFPTSDSFDSSSFPRSPQEVSFKREPSPVLKQESDTEEETSRLTRSIYVNHVGGKSVTRERRSVALSRRQSRISKRRGRSPSFDGTKIAYKLDGVGYVLDENTGQMVLRPNREPGPDRAPCDFPGCSKSFQRPEHLKRHKDTHSGERNFPCLICRRVFNRNDNCREHMWTHVAQPGKKAGRNSKMSLAEVESFCSDPVDGPKLIEKLRQKWNKSCEDAGMPELMVS